MNNLPTNPSRPPIYLDPYFAHSAPLVDSGPSKFFFRDQTFDSASRASCQISFPCAFNYFILFYFIFCISLEVPRLVADPSTRPDLLAFEAKSLPLKH